MPTARPSTIVWAAPTAPRSTTSRTSIRLWVRVFILNASRRLYSDRFFTSGFRPEFYSTLGFDWVNHNGPGAEMLERGAPNGHRQPVSPLKRILLRTMPELSSELQDVVNAFDPWARDRGAYYSLEWKPAAAPNRTKLSKSKGGQFTGQSGGK